MNQRSGDSRRASSRGLRWAALVALIGLPWLVLAFLNSQRLGFLGDDTWVLLTARDGPVFGEYVGVGTEFFRPLTASSLWIMEKAFGTDATGYHLLASTIHVLNAALVGLLAGRLVVNTGPLFRPSESPRLAVPVGMIAGLLFLYHPSAGEAHYWISAQGDRIATSFSLLALLCFLESIRGGRVWSWLSLAALGLALLAKESAVGTALVLLVASTGVGYLESSSGTVSGRLRAALARATPLAAVAVAYVAARWAVLGTPWGGYGADTYSSVPPLRWVLNSASVLARSFLPSMPAVAWVVAAGLIAAVGAGGILWMARRASSTTGKAVAVSGCALATLVLLAAPVAPLGVSAVGAEGERYAYLPAAAASMMAATGLVVGMRRISGLSWSFVLAVPVVTVVALAPICVREANRWNDASIAAEHITAGLATSGAETVVLLNAPDTVRGAISFRNSAVGMAFHDALGPQSVRVATARRFARPREDDRVVQEVLGDGTRRVTVRIASPVDPDPAGAVAVDDGPWRLLTDDVGSYTIDVRGDESGPEVLAYMDGRLARSTDE